MSENRLNYLKNFNHVVHDRIGSMEEFSKRVSKEVKDINDEIFDKKPKSDEIKPKALNINKKAKLPKKKMTWPYGNDGAPPPTFK